jgi:N6-L-threonylcarbamoyladenine synthase
MRPMLVLGIESSCDETGMALYSTDAGGTLLAHALHSQVRMHADYGGVVPGTRVARSYPTHRAAAAAGAGRQRPLAWPSSMPSPTRRGRASPARCWWAPLSPKPWRPRSRCRRCPCTTSKDTCCRRCCRRRPPRFPFVALLVSGGHSQLMRVTGVGEYELMGETLDDAAGEAFDKTAKLLGLGYPGGPALAALAESGRAGRVKLPRPMLQSSDLDFSFSGLKTAALTQGPRTGRRPATRSAPTLPAVSRMRWSKCWSARRCAR